MYPYWCTEKGYARWAGTNDGSAAWRDRALGWIKVMNVDILASMVIYCAATLRRSTFSGRVYFMRGALYLPPRT